ncbi:MAG: GNAT family N-acetyltransferase [Nonomuraea sp.]|nr:GNAT family N-acetyltransferase [Nonomuraea sp.]
MNEVIRAHAARVRALDPLVGGQDALSAEGQWLEVAGGVAVASTDRVEEGTEAALWSPLVVHRLRARVCGPDPAATLGALIDRWGAEPGEETGLAVLWPSRDTAPVRALIERGFVPIVNIAARRRGRFEAPVDAAIRPATPDDLDQIAVLYEALVSFDTQFGWETHRPSAPALIRASAARTLGGAGWCWVAEEGGRVVGFVSAEPPDRSGWIAWTTTARPVAYLDCMYADPGARGRGVGAALAAHAHARIDAAGVGVTLLHHAVPNPLSTPFWGRQGYRPIMTQWVRIPRST